MGVIKRQGIKGTIVSYAGVVIGYLSFILLMPYCLSTEQIGLIRVIIDAGTFFGTIGLFGVFHGIIRYTPFYNHNAEEHRGFMRFMFLIPTVGLIVFLLFFFLFYDYIMAYYSENSPLLVEFGFWIAPLTIMIVVQQYFEAFCNQLLRIVVPRILREVILRINVALMVIIYYLKYINLQEFIIGLMAVYLLSLIALIAYSLKISPFSFFGKAIYPSKEKQKEILIFCGFVIFGSLGTMLAAKIDSFMIAGTADGLSKAGIYTTIALMASMIEMPGRAMISMASPKVAQSIKVGDMDDIEKMYKRVSTILLSVASLIFMLIWFNLNSLFQVMPKGSEYATGLYVFFFIGFGKMIDSFTSTNLVIIQNSKYYKFSLILILFLGVLTIITNAIFIPIWGMYGAAAATLLTVFIYNLVSVIFVQWKFKINPLSNSTWKIILLFGACFALFTFLPRFSNPYVDVVFRIIAISLLFLGGLHFMHVSDDFRRIYQQIRDKIPFQK